MRQQLLDAIRTLAPNGVTVSSELPYEGNQQARYLKNPKTLYVDRDTIDSTPAIQTLDRSVSLNQETTRVSVFFTTDAKNLISSYDTIINKLRALKDTINVPGANFRECLVSTDYVGDLLITELEYRMTKLT